MFKHILSQFLHTSCQTLKGKIVVVKSFSLGFSILFLRHSKMCGCRILYAVSLTQFVLNRHISASVAAAELPLPKKAVGHDCRGSAACRAAG